jgi:hypothetical protein
MYTREIYLERIYFGFDASNLFFRFDPREAAWSNSNENGVETYLPLPEYFTIDMRVNGKSAQIEIPAKRGLNLACNLYREGNDAPEKINPPCAAAADKIWEISLPFALLELKPGQEIKFFVSLNSKKREMARYPGTGFLSITAPGPDFERRMWSA